MKKFALTLKILIGVSVLANGLGLLWPFFTSADAHLYSEIAKNILNHNDWVNLSSLTNPDWLDKPHFPFWVIALFYKIMGVSVFSYILPGFLANLVGAFYTFKLAKIFYNQEVGLLSALIFVSTLHLMISSIDVRAEAYLVAEIMPACYYWLRYDQKLKLKYLLLGSLFTALALMTKGSFVLVTIFSGLFCSAIFSRQWSKFISMKWFFAFLLSFVFIAPELMALYQQFDLHPEKLIFGHTHVSGLKFFFWDSQFGRFFDVGPIQKGGGGVGYFVPVFLWGFLPWSLFYVAAVIGSLRKFKFQNTELQKKIVYLLGSFFVTFVMFSLSKFQLDHYLNIIYPFSAIICAKFFYDCFKEGHLSNKAIGLQFMIAYSLFAADLALVGCVYFIYDVRIQLSVLMMASILAVIILSRCKERAERCVMASTFSIIILLLLVGLAGWISLSTRYGIYKIQSFLNQNPTLSLYDKTGGGKNIDPAFNIKVISNFSAIQDLNNGFFLLINKQEASVEKQAFPKSQILYCGVDLGFISRLQWIFYGEEKWLRQIQGRSEICLIKQNPL